MTFTTFCKVFVLTDIESASNTSKQEKRRAIDEDKTRTCILGIFSGAAIVQFEGFLFWPFWPFFSLLFLFVF